MSNNSHLWIARILVYEEEINMEILEDLEKLRIINKMMLC